MYIILIYIKNIKKQNLSDLKILYLVAIFI